METFLKDMSHGARVLVKRPGFTALLVLILALGIGANTAIFSILDTVLLRPLPFRDPDRLTLIFGTRPDKDVTEGHTSPLNFLDLRARSRSFDGMSALQDVTGTLLGGAEPEALSGWSVDHAFFPTLGIQPAEGRTFSPQEDRPGGDMVMLLSHRVWQRQFGGDPQVIGKAVTLDGTPFTVIGVMPADFDFPSGSDFWIPLQLDAQAFDRGSHSLTLLARLKRGVELERAQSELAAIAGSLGKEYPDPNEGRGFSVVPIQQQLVGKLRPALLVLLGAVALVLLIACGNAAGLLIGRIASRTNEVAIRTALGADRGRIVRQFLTESLLLALLAGVAGLLLGWWAAGLLATFGPQEIPRLQEVGLDVRVLGFTLLLTLLTVLLFGVVPALQGARPDLVNALKEGGAGPGIGRGRHRMRKLLVIAELTLTLTLMVTAGLLARSFVSLIQVAPGFQSSEVLTLDVSLPRSRYKRPEALAFYSRLLAEVRALPGVRSAAAVMNRPIKGQNSWRSQVSVTGRPVDPDQALEAFMNPVTPDYFKTLRIPLLKGREFGDGDGEESTPVVILSQQAARRLFPGEDPLGRSISHELDLGRMATTRTVVGVVGDVLQAGLSSQEEPQIYVPHRQAPFPAMSLVIRTQGDPLRLASAARNKIRELDKDLPLEEATTMDDVVAESVGQPRFYMGLVAGFAVLGLILAAVGIYGLLASEVAQRRREIGIRMALGAQAGSVAWMIVGQALALCALGLALGLGASLALRQLISGLLFGIESTDLLTYVLVSALLLAVALLASLIPARRATRVDPLLSMRYE
nr:ABC transporter, permease component [uncultured bacterium]